MQAFCNFDQLVRVVGLADAGVKHTVIARQLCFSAKLCESVPAKWVEPEQRGGNAGHEMNRPIAPLNMDEFMKKRNLKPVGGPVASLLGQEDCGPEKAERFGYRHGTTDTYIGR
jgi:hypothetical protein